jgi:hypothetical protein
MLQRTLSRTTTHSRALALPMDNDESFGPAPSPQAHPFSLYALAVALRIGFVAAILVKALAIWQW